MNRLSISVSGQLAMKKCDVDGREAVGDERRNEFFEELALAVQITIIIETVDENIQHTGASLSTLRLLSQAMAR